ncbi:hypothetical protein NOVOSPHI9U_750061 [Novosphingobium sp. 9U]|nr:hypothetical protein NOVOSPHI9U_750061 [Novosphingobium sp. 9U]
MEKDLCPLGVGSPFPSSASRWRGKLHYPLPSRGEGKVVSLQLHRAFKHVERHVDRRAADARASDRAEVVLAMVDVHAPPRTGEVHQAFLVARRSGAGKAGHRQRDIRVRGPQGALRHVLGDLATNHAEPFDPRERDREQLALRLWRVDHEAALEGVAAIGDVGEQCRQQAAGAALRRGDRQVTLAGEGEEVLGLAKCFIPEGFFECFGHASAHRYGGSMDGAVLRFRDATWVKRYADTIGAPAAPTRQAPAATR